jgi:hypothetical protein
VHKFYLLGDSLVDTSHGLVKGAAYRSEEKRIPLLVACAAGELAAASFLVEVNAHPFTLSHAHTLGTVYLTKQCCRCCCLGPTIRKGRRWT